MHFRNRFVNQVEFHPPPLTKRQICDAFKLQAPYFIITYPLCSLKHIYRYVHLLVLQLAHASLRGAAATLAFEKCIVFKRHYFQNLQVARSKPGENTLERKSRTFLQKTTTTSAQMPLAICEHICVDRCWKRGGGWMAGQVERARNVVIKLRLFKYTWKFLCGTS